ncbi:TIGR03668 family PPOX class F420-dependent oxidoreductase [Streptomyces hoynatensis]|uniref:TIGR03668 family PPOX class F420-dependent oxidoreductase n=1 Tax=Streptomyces hoynatensis TaxID=1141874 RepID=A0A3A9YWX2_9ACTN|nr:TIGR03668 family PPOX class F420-dependent oxidoreductase [Streptomyces hoynatensis]RKN40425.1 TIGR03668 family PPOX class F420-dependent oxidoreductase [Streptomyces hoynatensis]
MQLSETEARARLAAARVLRLATVDEAGAPHLVPVTFAVHDGRLVTAVDEVKPKRHPRLARLRHVRADPRVCLLADSYEEDWSRLWWVRAEGRAEILEGPAREGPLDSLARKYPPYRARRPAGPVLAVAPTRWTGWAAS